MSIPDTLLPSLAIGRALGDGFCIEDRRLRDADAHGPRAIVVELAREGDPARIEALIEFASGPARRVLRRMGPFDLRYRALDAAGELDGRAAGNACVALANAIERDGFDDARSALRQATTTHEPVPESADRSDDGDIAREIDALAPSLASLALRCKAPAIVHAIALDGRAVTFPDEAIPIGSFRVLPANMRGRRVIHERLAALGFAANLAGVVRSVPTPKTFARRADALGLSRSGFMPELVAIDRMAFDLPEWLDGYLRGAIAVPCAQRRFHARRARLFKSWRSKMLDEHVTVLAHDLGVHALSLHALPETASAVLRDEVGRAARAARARDRVDALTPLIVFFEEDLVRHCDAIWETIGHPNDFARAHALSEAALRARIDARISETESMLSAPPSLGERLRRRIRQALFG